MRKFWTALALAFAALTVGALASAGGGSGGPRTAGDLVTPAVLAAAAWVCWKARR